MRTIIRSILLLISFTLFIISYFFTDSTDYDFWIILFLYWIAENTIK